MTKEEVEKWCEKNDYILVSLKDKISITKIKRIAEKSVNVATINPRKSRHRSTFGRHLAVSYLKDKYPRKEIARQLEINDSAVYSSERRGKDIFNTKFNKQWKEEAVMFFKEKIKEIETSL